MTNDCFFNGSELMRKSNVQIVIYFTEINVCNDVDVLLCVA